MNAHKSIREEVKRYIDEADEMTVRMIHAMIEVRKEGDWWDELPSYVQKEIDDAIESLDKGQGMVHEDVVKKYGKWFAK